MLSFKKMTDGKIMRITIIYLIWIICLIISSPCSGSDSRIHLSPEEKIWIKENPIVRVRIGNSPPFMLTEEKVQGIAIDYLTHIFDINGIKIKYISSSDVTWPKALEYIKRHEVVDMVPTAKITKERKKNMIFTDEYIFAPWVIFTRSDADFVSSIDDLNGKTVSVEEGYVMHLELKQNYPGIKLKVISANRKNFAQIPVRDLSTGLVDAYIGNLLSTTYAIQTKGYTNVKVAAPTPFDNHNQAMAIRSDWQELVSIINKSLASMTSEEHAAIRNKWLSIRYEYGINKVYVLKWVLSVTGIACFIIVFVLIWNKRLKTEVILRKNMETALKDSEKKYKALFNNAQVALFRTGISDGKLLDINERYADMAGYSTIEDCMAEFNAADAWVDVSERDKLVEALQENGFVFDYETQVIRRDKAAIWISFSATIFSEKGYIEGSIVEITNRKQAEERLQNSQELLNEVGSIARIGGWEHDLVTSEATWTRETYNIVEIESGPVPGPDEHLSYYKPKDREILEEAYRLSIETGEQFDLKLQAATTNGRSLWVRVVGRPEYRDGACVKMKGILQDITEQKTVEMQLQQAQKMESIGRLAGGVAHDYNNISSIIIGYSELALEQVKQNDPLHEDLMEILTAAKRSTDITRQLLAFARKQTIAPKVLDLNDFIGNILKMVQRLIGEDIDLAWMPGTEVWPVKIDPSQVDQIIANLAVNARDAIADVGKLTIETKNISFDEEYCADHAGFIPGEYLLLAVSDDGSGIAPGILDKIFEPFFTTKEVGKGTGLGLSTVYGIVKQNNGFINVYSEPKKGTSIKIYLPRHEGQAVEAYSDNNIEIPLSRGETVLLVEDDGSILKLGKRILEELGYIVLSSSSPLEATKLAEEQAGELNLLITDVIMPEMNGRELSENLKSLLPNLKILFMSGYTANVIAHRGVLDDDVSFISKPFSKKDMAIKVREVLDEAKGSI